jgi:tetratricopeptide (TPR) repeat protein
MPNRLSRFWQELKRRNVTRVLAVYIAVAFMLLELLGMISDPFGLPEWCMKVGFFILLAGLVITLIYSWVYDVHPEGGIVKTEPVKQGKPEGTPNVSKRWRNASYISFVVIVGLIVLNIIPRSGKKAYFDKSIAVLPFTNNSPDARNDHVINGYRAAIHDMLCSIKDLRVIALSSTEQYQEHQKPGHELARELNVGYLLSASAQELGNQIRLIVQLMDEDATIIWSKTYDRQINIVQDHIDIQSGIAQKVAGQIGVIISPVKQQLMDRAPTTNLTAYDLIFKSQKYFNQYTLTKDRDYLERVTQLCNLALDLDPDFALSYYWLGKSALSEKIEDYRMGSLKPSYLDTALFFFNKALELDPDLPEAYAERGIYYIEKTQRKQAIDDLKKAIQLSPNNQTAYLNSGTVYLYSRDYKNAMINLKKAEILNGSDEMLIPLYRDLWFLYAAVGDWEKAESAFRRMIHIHPEYGLAAEMWSFILKGNYTELLQAAEEFSDQYQDNKYGYLYKARSLLHLGRTQEAEDCIRTMLQYGEPDRNTAHRVGIIFWMNGKSDEAMEYFNLQIDYCKESIDSKDDLYGKLNAAYDLAGVYALLGMKEEAIRWLTEYERLGFIAGMHEYIKTDPLFDNLRNDEEFKEIVSRANEKAAALRAELQEMEEY